MRLKEGVLKDEGVTEIGGDRRLRRRYDLDLQLQYRVLRRNQFGPAGTGKTINLSGDGIALDIGEVLLPGSPIELTISWPVLLNSACALNLVVTGRVARSDAALTAVCMDRYEFRTQSTPALQSRAAG